MKIQVRSARFLKKQMLQKFFIALVLAFFLNSHAKGQSSTERQFFIEIDSIYKLNHDSEKVKSKPYMVVSSRVIQNQQYVGICYLTEDILRSVCFAGIDTSHKYNVFDYGDYHLLIHGENEENRDQLLKAMDLQIQNQLVEQWPFHTFSESRLISFMDYPERIYQYENENLVFLKMSFGSPF
jgi:hypothetical protein